VLSRIDLRGQTAVRLSGTILAGVLPRARLDVEAAMDAVRPVCEDVRRRGAVAVREQTAKFDGVDLISTRVPAAALNDALERLDPGVRAALQEAARRTRLVHEAQLPGQTVTTVGAGTAVTDRYVPVARAGVYVPGGLVAYPSSVVMNVVPAQVAGVGEIAVASPPGTGRGGLPHPAVLAACALLGISEVHAVGGAQAIAMFAYGTADCVVADMVSGPGNVYVAAAVFVGQWAPVSLGDYLAGSNHVLPTGGTARRSGGLSVLSFLRVMHVIDCSEAGLAAAAPYIDTLGGAEDLAAHVSAVRARVPAAAGAMR